MSVEGVIIGEVITDVMMILAEKARAAGVAEEEIQKMIDIAKAKALASRPEDFPDL